MSIKDINNNFIGNNPDIVKKSIEARFKDPAIVDEIISIDNDWRKCKITSLTNDFDVV